MYKYNFYLEQTFFPLSHFITKLLNYQKTFSKIKKISKLFYKTFYENNYKIFKILYI